MTTIHDLYIQAYKICQRADKAGKWWIGFRNDKQIGFKMFASRDNNNGRSSYRANLPIADWASNGV